ncbi:amino acid ABC transporter ATP-binding protein [Phyllobacterium sp. YR531]|uniref:amino acid ABC transporter ATP-binding protein n=1 Tax=Phyllobacterium sp. YR531 TaxID=1144343 RepID=UPI00026FB1CA|nr:amino acid ABC transporter ATP-binding protein [Phyllobacterium sp. YR531]EJN06727.1 ABC-type polar amino acid transport system, ATPase component [Phyllobacterium sp. YR531]
MNELLRCNDLVKRYGSHSAVNGVNFSVNEGETIAIIGPSGSGKSTLLRCLNLLETPTEGEIFFKGKQVGCKSKVGAIEYLERDLVSVRQRMGMVFQNFNLFPHLTVEENISLGPCKIRRISHDVARKAASSLLEIVGMAGMNGKYPGQLSGGQQQRVAIARALAMEPDAVLFDEPTSALDPEMISEVLDVMKALSDRGMTMIVVTHEISFAANVADRVIFFDGGQIKEDGPPEYVISQPRTARMVQFINQHTAFRPDIMQ